LHLKSENSETMGNVDNNLPLETDELNKNDKDPFGFQEECKNTENDGDGSSSLSNCFMSPKLIGIEKNDCFTN